MYKKDFVLCFFRFTVFLTASPDLLLFLWIDLVAPPRSSSADAGRAELLLRDGTCDDDSPDPDEKAAAIDSIARSSRRRMADVIAVLQSGEHSTNSVKIHGSWHRLPGLGCSGLSNLVPSIQSLAASSMPGSPPPVHATAADAADAADADITATDGTGTGFVSGSAAASATAAAAAGDTGFGRFGSAATSSAGSVLTGAAELEKTAIVETFLEGLDSRMLKVVIDKYKAGSASKIDKRGGAEALRKKILLSRAYVDAIAEDGNRAVAALPPVRTVAGMVADLFRSKRAAQQRRGIAEGSTPTADSEPKTAERREYVDTSRWVDEPSTRERLTQEFAALLSREGKSDFYRDLIQSDSNRILHQHIPGFAYKCGRDEDLKKEPYSDCASKWYNPDRGQSFGPQGMLPASSLRVFPFPYKADDGTQMVLFQHDGPRQSWWFDGNVQQWECKLANWQILAPNIKQADKSNPFEKEHQRSKATSNKANIAHCFETAKCVGYPSTQVEELKWKEFKKDWLKEALKTKDSSSQEGTEQKPRGYNSYISKFSKFRLDMYGNVITLPASVDGGLASNNALTFFDIDHVFPFCRGGRSVKENFAAVQCVANRSVKSDNLLQTLSPRQMNCGLMATQLISMVEWVEEKFGDERNTKNSLLDSIIGWLTKSPMNGDTFSRFQDPIGPGGGVGYTVNALVLLQYFGHRQEREYQRILALGRALGTGEASQAALDSNAWALHGAGAEVAAEVELRSKGAVEREPARKQKKELRVRTEGVDELTRRVIVSGCTYPHRMQLRAELGFSFSYEGEDALWHKQCFGEKDLECVLTDLRALADENKLKLVDEDSPPRTLSKKVMRKIMSSLRRR